MYIHIEKIHLKNKNEFKFKIKRILREIILRYKKLH